MNSSREKALFALALEKPADEREAILDAMCGGDPALRKRLAVTEGGLTEGGAPHLENGHLWRR